MSVIRRREDPLRVIAARNNRAHLRYMYKRMKSINGRLWEYRIGALMFSGLMLVLFFGIYWFALMGKAMGPTIWSEDLFLAYPVPLALLFAVVGWCVGYFPTQYGPWATARGIWRGILEDATTNSWHRRAFLELEEIDPRLFRKIVRITRIQV